MPKKARADSVTEAVRVNRGAVVSPPSNVPLDPEDMGFFASVIAEFARSEWAAHQLELAAMLARTMANMESEQRKLREEGSVAKSDRGTPVINPRKVMVQMLAGSILSFRRSLSLHARAQKGEARELGRRRDIERDAEIATRDDLLARPN